MSQHGDNLYSKSVLFTLVATVTVLIGTIMTVFVPMFTDSINPKLETLKPYTAIELAGRDIYQREGCLTCHTQTVRPLKTEVLRYGDYSKAGEFYYDRPFLWGSKRTGPDLARVGGKYTDEWHRQHMIDPRAFFAESNMPSYAFLQERMVDAEQTKANMDGLGFPYEQADIESLKQTTELEALIAYLQVIGTAVTGAQRKQLDIAAVPDENPLAGSDQAAANGRTLYIANCAPCHGDYAGGQEIIGSPELTTLFARYESMYNMFGDTTQDKFVLRLIAQGGMGQGAMMPAFGTTLEEEQLWSLVEYLKSIQQ